MHAMISGRCGQRRLPRQAVGENNGLLDVFVKKKGVSEVPVLPVSVSVRVSFWDGVVRFRVEAQNNHETPFL